jgi:hypothetical protein
MIVRIELKSKRKTPTMMFGNSYKNWGEQFREYCFIFKPIEIIQVETSPEKWIGWGGLKWCNESEFQHELSREGCQQNDQDNPKPRKYHYMKFNRNQIVENIANKIARRYL